MRLFCQARLPVPLQRALSTAAISAALIVATGCQQPDADPEADSAQMTASTSPELSLKVEQLLQRAEHLRQQERESEGLALLQNHLAQHPATPKIHYALGVLHGSMDDHNSAIREFKIALSADEHHFESYRGLAAAYTRLGLVEESLSPLQTCMAMRPDDLEIRFQLGRNLSALGRFETAEPHLLAVVQARDDADAWTELGTLARRRGDFDDAIAAFRKALARDPGQLAALLNLGQLINRQGDSEAAAILLERHRAMAVVGDRLDHLQRSSRLAGATAANFAALADAQLAAGKPQEAIASYRRALQMSPGFPTAALGLASLLLDRGELDEATRWSVTALMHDPDNVRSHYLIGMVRLAKGQFDEAEQAFLASQQRGAWGAEAYLRVAEAYREAGRTDRATALVDRADELAPEQAQVSVQRGLNLLWDSKPSAAAAEFNQAVAVDPDHANAWMALGISLVQSGDTDEAELAFRAALRAQQGELLTGISAAQISQRFKGYPDASDALRLYLSVAGRE